MERSVFMMRRSGEYMTGNWLYTRRQRVLSPKAGSEAILDLWTLIKRQVGGLNLNLSKV